ncbi:MAG: ABC transporter substrate-binding protein [Selenomonadaceae bacterium]|nr:ABC transporter substrate-binding protein [Selenomonadaceae bacterium]
MIEKFFVGILIAGLLVTACAPEKNSPPAQVTQAQVFATVTDDAGRQVTLVNKPVRIVVTSAGFLEPMHAVGCQIVGRPDSKNQMPDWARDISSVGQVYQIDTERLIACQPDLVVVNAGMNEKLLPLLDENKIPALVVEMKTFDDVKRGLKLFATLSGDVDAGDKIVRDMDAQVKSIVDGVPKKNLRVAILHSTAQGVTVQLDGSIAGSIAKMFGWTNVADGMTPLEKNPDAAPYSLETLAQQNPDVIFVTSMGNVDEIKSNMLKAIESNDAWQTITAVKQNRLYFLPQDLFLLSPGLRYPEAVRTMATLIYPDK